MFSSQLFNVGQVGKQATQDRNQYTGGPRLTTACSVTVQT